MKLQSVPVLGKYTAQTDRMAEASGTESRSETPYQVGYH